MEKYVKFQQNNLGKWCDISKIYTCTCTRILITSSEHCIVFLKNSLSSFTDEVLGIRGSTTNTTGQYTTKLLMLM